MAARFHQRMGGGRLFEREGLVDHRFDLARDDHRQRVVFDRGTNRAFVGDRARTQGRAGVMQPLEHHAHEIDFRFRSALECDLHDTALHRGRFVIARDVISADHVQYNVGALVAGGRLGGCDEVIGFIVNGHVGPELAAGGAFFLRARGGDDARAERLGELNRRGADAGRAAMHQEGLAAFEAAAFHHVVPDGEKGFRNRGGLKSGETFLVHGGSSGIGTTAIQLAKALGARVITTAGSEEKCAACRKLGADVAINYKTDDFVAATKAATGDKGADVILDMVGGNYIARNYEAAAVEGRIVQIAFQGGPKAEVNFMRMMLKRLHHTGSTLRSRSVADKGAIRAAVEDNALPMIVTGKVKPVIYKTFPLKEAAAAHALMETSSHIGKIVLTL